MLSIAFCVAVVPVQAAHELKATQTNTNFLYTYGAWAKYGSGQLLKYSSINGLDVAPKTKTKIMVGTIDAVKVGNGQCTDFVKGVSKNSEATSNWIRGRKVVGGSISGGTAIAVFGSNNKYANSLTTSHTAIFGNYISSGFNIWDGNWVKSYLVGRHSIYTTGTGRSDADNYYVVEIPDTYIASHFAYTGDKAAVKEPNIVTDSYRNQLESFRMGSNDFTIQYRAHVANIGWMPYVNENENAGTQGTGNAIEAFKIKLIGASTGTHVYYRAYYNNAWGSWVSDDAQAGTTGAGIPVKGMQVYIGTGSPSTSIPK